jgi:hypothetical protein
MNHIAAMVVVVVVVVLVVMVVAAAATIIVMMMMINSAQFLTFRLVYHLRKSVTKPLNLYGNTKYFTNPRTHKPVQFVSR